MHAGATVIGYDNALYRVDAIEHGHPAGPIVTLHGVGMAQPPPGTPIAIVAQPDMTAEAAAFTALHTAGLEPKLLGEYA